MELERRRSRRSVGELTSTAPSYMLSPRHGPGVCRECFNFTRGYDRCYACAAGEQRLDLVVPISYSVAHEELHRALANYKRTTGVVADRATLELTAVLWRFLSGHEQCVAAAVGVPAFDLVTTVPSSDRARDEHHQLRRIVGELAAPTRDRHVRLLRRTLVPAAPRSFQPDRFHASRRLEGASVLLIDDTWTTGASSQSAAAALKASGAGVVAAVVIGRHLNREWHENDRRLRGITQPFDWSTCPLCAPVAGTRYEESVSLDRAA